MLQTNAHDGLPSGTGPPSGKVNDRPTRRRPFLSPVEGPFAVHLPVEESKCRDRAEPEHLLATSEQCVATLSCVNVPGSNRKDVPQRSAGERYTTDTYRRAITRACDQAFPPPEPLAKRGGETEKQCLKRLTKEQKTELAAWRKAHRWHPHQL